MQSCMISQVKLCVVWSQALMVHSYAAIEVLWDEFAPGCATTTEAVRRWETMKNWQALAQALR